MKKIINKIRCFFNYHEFVEEEKISHIRSFSFVHILSKVERCKYCGVKKNNRFGHNTVILNDKQYNKILRKKKLNKLNKEQ